MQSWHSILVVAVVLTNVWMDQGWELHRRSWPPTRLERLAAEAGIDDSEVRVWLAGEIGRPG